MVAAYVIVNPALIREVEARGCTAIIGRAKNSA
jgi:hypothetical protein